ncbi:hypothetical protein TNCV_1370111 [Trichonephila clavipes]|nr:hypothetical protein TNCV_1370111 [Trichonephila clavipes]
MSSVSDRSGESVGQDYQRREQDVFVPCTQWIPLSSHTGCRALYDNIEYKHTLCVLVGAFRHRYVHQDATPRTENFLKRRQAVLFQTSSHCSFGSLAASKHTS